MTQEQEYQVSAGSPYAELLKESIRQGMPDLLEELEQENYLEGYCQWKGREAHDLEDKLLEQGMDPLMARELAMRTLNEHYLISS
ncbi:MAG: hypothetical protein EA399_17915 [Desulfovibrionales bacterium]|nr:MAG: hypothetical protein EA399_17915 [Desulfovibrionales bacterium]